MLYLCQELKPWHRNQGKRLTKNSKVYLNDVGLLQYLAPSNEPSYLGLLMEQFVFNELQKQIGWSRTRPNLYFWRTSNGREIDFIMEDRQGHILAIEVKASASVGISDFSHLKAFQKDFPDQFLAGLVVYKGDKLLPFGTNMYAIPITWLF